MMPYLLGSTNNIQNHKTNNRNMYQESEIFSNQEPKPEALFLVGSWLRPSDFGFVRTLDERWV
jgi:hypothetical protein